MTRKRKQKPKDAPTPVTSPAKDPEPAASRTPLPRAQLYGVGTVNGNRQKMSNETELMVAQLTRTAQAAGAPYTVSQVKHICGQLQRSIDPARAWLNEYALHVPVSPSFQDQCTLPAQ